MDARTLFSLIGVGRKNAVKRPKSEKVDREFRRLIEEANTSGEVIIINTGDGKGYYIPDLNDPYDRMEYLAYINAKKSRIRRLADSVNAMERAAEGYNQLCL